MTVKKIEFAIVRKNDETKEVLLNGEFLAELSHDTDGWEGMRRIESILEGTAEKLGGRLVRR